MDASNSQCDITHHATKALTRKQVMMIPHPGGIKICLETTAIARFLRLTLAMPRQCECIHLLNMSKIVQSWGYDSSCHSHVMWMLHRNRFGNASQCLVTR